MFAVCRFVQQYTIHPIIIQYIQLLKQFIVWNLASQPERLAMLALIHCYITAVLHPTELHQNKLE